MEGSSHNRHPILSSRHARLSCFRPLRRRRNHRPRCRRFTPPFTSLISASSYHRTFLFFHYHHIYTHSAANHRAKSSFCGSSALAGWRRRCSSARMCGDGRYGYLGAGRDGGMYWESWKSDRRGKSRSGNFTRPGEDLRRWIFFVIGNEVDFLSELN